MSQKSRRRLQKTVLWNSVRGLDAGVLYAFNMIQRRVREGESLAEALSDDFPRDCYPELDNAAYIGASEVLSWLSDYLDHPPETEETA